MPGDREATRRRACSGRRGEEAHAVSNGDDLSPDDEAIFEADPFIGSALQGRFRIESVLGHGRTGRVYRATQFPMNRPVAVKIIRSDLRPIDDALIRRFGVLVGKSARLSHPHTVTLIDYGATEKRDLFIAMELVPGPPLASMLDREAPFDWERATRIALQIARSLRDAHYNGVIHRGLSPNNLFLVEGDDDREFVKVADFGVFGIFPFDVGRPPPPVQRSRKNWDAAFAYTAPEQIQSGAQDARIDVYALGCVLFEMLADRPPFVGRSASAVAQQHLEAEPPRLDELGFPVPPLLEAAIRGCLEKTPANRIGSMSDLMLRLKEVLGAGLTGDLTLSTSPLPIPEVTQSEAPRRPELQTGEAAFRTMEPEGPPPLPSPWRKRIAVALTGIAAGAIAAAVWWSLPAETEVETDRGPAPVEVDEVASVAANATSRPAGAQVFVDGELVGTTPLQWDQPRSAEEVLVILRLPGYVEAVDRVVFDAPRNLTFTLEPAPEAPTDEVDAPVEADDYKQNPY